MSDGTLEQIRDAQAKETTSKIAGTASKTSTSTERTPVIFLTKNSQSDGVNSLKRMSFESDNWEYTLFVNPEEFSQTEANRVTVTQTKGGAYVDEFGSGLPTISMKGTTGFKMGTSDPTLGYKRFKMLRDKMRTIMDGVQPGQDISTDKELVFHNYTDGEHWVVVPKVFTLLRSVSRPLLYLYDIQLVCIRPADMPSVTSTLDNAFLVPTLTKVEVKS